MEPAPRFQILGPLRVRGSDGADVPITGARERALLTRLLVDVGVTVPEGQLLDDLWPESGSSARGSLQVRVSSLRRQLRGLAQVTRVGNGYRLEVEPASVDAVRMEGLVERSAAELPQDAVELLQEALALWDEPPLAELEGTPAELLRSRFDLVAQEARVRLGRALAESGRPEQAVTVLGPEWQGRTLDESVATPLVRALYAAGRAAEAVETHHRTVAALADQGLDPSPAFRSLVTEVLRHEVPLPSTAAAAVPAPRRPPEPSLRRPASAFLGRQGDLDAAVRSLTEDRVGMLTLWGPGGVGKTRLALEVTRRVASAYDEAPVLVDGAQVASSDQLPEAIRRSVGLSERGPALEDVLHAVTGRRLLLLIDNAEHLLEGVADVAEALASAQGPQVLVTSRAVVGLAQERVQPVSPWPLRSDGEELRADEFLRRRAEDMGARALDEADAATLAAIAERLDGLPLALELAAARLRTWSPSAMLAQLGDQLDTLGTLRDLPPRQRSLEATLEWSAGLLDDPTRRLLLGLGVFAGPARLEAVHAVCEEADADRLALLVDHALVQPTSTDDGNGAFTVLETLRSWARTRSTPEDRAAWEQRHAAHFAEEAVLTTRRLLTAEQRAATVRLDEQRADLDRALGTLAASGRDAELRTMVLAMWRWWFGAGAARTAVGWLDRVSAVDDDTLDAVRAAAMLVAARACIDDAPAAEHAWAVAQERATAGGFSSADAPELPVAAWFVHALRGEPEEALAAAWTAVASLEAHEQPVLAAEMRLRAGLAMVESGDPESCEQLHREALDVMVAHGPRWEQGGIYNNLAHLALARGDSESALADALASLEVYQQLPFARDRWVAWETLMSIRARRGERDLARGAASRALEESSRAGDLESARRVRVELADLEAADGEVARAARSLLALPPDAVGDALRWQLAAVAARVLLGVGDATGAAVAAALADASTPDPFALFRADIDAVLDRARGDAPVAPDLASLCRHLRDAAVSGG